MNHQLHTEVTINAAPSTVWRTLTGLDGYADWNPFIVSSEISSKVSSEVSSGDTVAVGQRLTNRMSPPGGRAVTFRPTVTEVAENEVFEWLGRMGLPGLFDGRHRFELHATGDGSTRLIHSESFSGILVRPFRKSLDTQTLAGFEAMNTALKQRVEATTGCSR